MRGDDKTGIRDSLEKIKKNLLTIANSKYWLRTVCGELSQNQLARSGLLHALYRIKQQYLDTIDDFDGENLDVLSEEELERWNEILQRIETIEGTDKKERNLTAIYIAANDLLELDKSDLIRRREKLKFKLHGNIKPIKKDTNLSPSGTMRPRPTSSSVRRTMSLKALQRAEKRRKIRSKSWEKADKTFRPKRRRALDFVPFGIAMFLSGITLFIGLAMLSNDILGGAVLIGLAIFMALVGLPSTGGN